MMVWLGAASSAGEGEGIMSAGAQPMTECEFCDGGEIKRVDVMNGARLTEGSSSCCSNACVQAPVLREATAR